MRPHHVVLGNNNVEVIVVGCAMFGGGGLLCQTSHPLVDGGPLAAAALSLLVFNVRGVL